MLEIMQELQNQYCPDDDSFIFFGGDQLTEERARNMQKARACGKTRKQRLQPLFPKNEDWHLIQSAYDVSQKMF